MAQERESRVAWPQVNRSGGNLDGETQKQVRNLLNDFGLALEDEAAAAGISIFAFPLFREFNLVAGVTPERVLVAISPSTGGLPSLTWQDWRQSRPPPSGSDLAMSVRQQLGWDRFEVLIFEADLLGQDSATRSPRLREIAKRNVKEVVMEAERQARVVRLNPIFEGRDFLIEHDLCFVLIPFREPFYRIYEDHIKPTLEAAGLRVTKADDVFTPTAIIEDIWECVNKSRLLVADVTGRNPNVFYELGMAHTVGKEVIILTQDEGDIPFDLRHLRYFKYTDNEEGWETLRRNLTKAAQAIVKQ